MRRQNLRRLNYGEECMCPSIACFAFSEAIAAPAGDCNVNFPRKHSTNLSVGNYIGVVNHSQLASATELPKTLVLFLKP